MKISSDILTTLAIYAGLDMVPMKGSTPLSRDPEMTAICMQLQGKKNKKEKKKKYRK